MFEKRIEKEYLKLAQIVYGGDFYFELNNYELKEIDCSDLQIKKVVDKKLSQKGIDKYFSYKNENTGFTANLFENKKTKTLVIAFRGTERLGLGENETDISAFVKDVVCDSNLLTGSFDKQFIDAYNFYKTVKKQYPKRKIVIIGQSLGGALAQIISAKEYTVNRNKVETYTFNAPGCFNLLDLYGCAENLSYSFIVNYSVMNDWCGMFGEHVGQRYLLLPIVIENTPNASKTEVLNNILLKTHEGIFDFAKEKCKVFRKPKNFSQREGLSLWYFDKNNPIREYRNLSEFVSVNNFNFDTTQIEHAILKAENFIKDNIPESIQNSTVATAIKTAADNIAQIQSAQMEKFVQNVNKTAIMTAIKVLDSVISELNEESLEKAQNIVKKMQNRWF